MKKTGLALQITAGIVSAMLLVTSCKKGEQGPAGPQGPAGKDGVANITTFTFAVTSSQWVANAPFYEYDYTSSAITSNVLSKGAVMVYMGDNTTWIALPTSVTGTEFNFGIQLSTIGILYSMSDGTMPSSPPSSNLTFKVVIIPPAMVKPNVNLKNYAEVKAAYNLKD